MERKTPIIACLVYLCFLLLLFISMIRLSTVEGAVAEVPSSIDLFLLIDQSGSMKKTDPEGLRLETSKYLVDFLAAHYTAVSNHRLGVIHFGTPAPEEMMIPLTPLVETNLERIKQKLVPLNLADTSFITALQLRGV